jgi:hypothetical protein
MDKRPKKIVYFVVMPLWLTFLVSIPYANNLRHAFDGEPVPVTIEELNAGKRPPGHRLHVTGYVDSRNGVFIETKSRGARVSGENYLPVISQSQLGAPVGVLVRPQYLEQAELDSFKGPRVFDATVRDVFWEGLASSDRSIIEDAGVKLAPDVLLLSTATPSQLLRNALIAMGVTLVLSFLGLVYSYRVNLREWQAKQKKAA